MTLKVIRINTETRPVSDASREAKADNPSKVQDAKPAVQTPVSVSTDAVRNMVRAGSAPGTESARIKDFKSARETAGDVAEKVRSKEKEAKDTHASLDKVPAREHLVH